MEILYNTHASEFERNLCVVMKEGLTFASLQGKLCNTEQKFSSNRHRNMC